jgi:hypothetical protein
LRRLKLLCGLFALLLGCTPGQHSQQASTGQAVFISGVVIRNELPYAVTEVMIEVPATGAFAGCGNIPPSSECSNTFESRDYRANAMLIRWTEHGQPHQTDEFTLELPPEASAGDTFHVEVIVFSPGQAGARLVGAQVGEIRNR